jgi:hypothetical protein
MGSTLNQRRHDARAGRSIFNFSGTCVASAQARKQPLPYAEPA